MSPFLLRRNCTSLAYPNHFEVILTLDDGFELRVGGISEGLGAGTVTYWNWSCIGSYGRCTSRELAMAAFKGAWVNVTADMIEAARKQQEWTDDKYALWDAGFRNLTKPLRCACGENFDAGSRTDRRLHIPHLQRRAR